MKSSNSSPDQLVGKAGSHFLENLFDMFLVMFDSFIELPCVNIIRVNRI